MKRRILLVDDERTVLLTLKAVLEMNGYEVETADSAASAIDLLNRGEYRMVITDSHMEADDSGLRVIESARRKTQKPVTILLTAFPPGDGDSGDVVLLKPLGTPELLRQIEAFLSPKTRMTE